MSIFDRFFNNKTTNYVSPEIVQKFGIQRNDHPTELDILGKCLNINDKFAMFYGPSRPIVNTIENWSLNRKINLEHRNNLVNGILSSGFVIGPLQIIFCKTSKRLVLIDGGHRHEALRIIFNKDIQKNIPCYSLVYFYTNLDEKITNSMFKIVNNCLNIQPEHIPNEFFVEFLTEIKKSKYKGFIKASNRCHRPSISEKNLIENITICKQIYPDISISKFFDFIDAVNSQFAKTDLKQFSETGKINKTLTINFEKCQEVGFYLSLKLQWSKDMIKIIERNFSNT